MRNKIHCGFLLLFSLGASSALLGAESIEATGPSESHTDVGFVLHFDHLSSSNEVTQLIKTAKMAGADVINIVPPSRIWDHASDVQTLDLIIDEIGRNNLFFLLTRIDASCLADNKKERKSSLYTDLLNKPGRRPSGDPTVDTFLTTANVDEYRKWMEDETRFYAKRYGSNPRLLGIDLGPFSEPFASQRGGFLQYDFKSNYYELTQYTEPAKKGWHQWLRNQFPNIKAINRDYETNYKEIDDIPLPLNESDSRFGAGQRAYFDFTRSLNDWYLECYLSCRNIWRKESGSTAPFILQMSGTDAEKFVRGRPAVWAFSWLDWINQADAVGLSLYTNGTGEGHADFGHRSIRSMVDVLNLSLPPKKLKFVLETGVEAPDPVFLESELTFIASQALRLDPATFIYAFFKIPFNSAKVPHDGRLILSTGNVQSNVLTGLKNLFSMMFQPRPEEEKEKLTVVYDPLAVRENLRIGEIYSTLLDASAELPIKWILAGNFETTDPDKIIWKPSDLKSSTPSTLDRLINEAPSARGPAYSDWINRLKQELAANPE